MQELNTQKYFDKIVRHLLTQGERAAYVNPDNDSQNCRYRIEQGGKTMKCAIGCMIPDELYLEGMEGKSIMALGNAYPVLHPLLSAGWVTAWGEKRAGSMESLNAKLQTIHDEVSPELWELQLRSLADQFCLTFPNLEATK